MASGGADLQVHVDDIETLTHSSKGVEKGRQTQRSNPHRMHRSSVRPFLCCGSQVSLNSITGAEFKELPVLPEKGDDEYEDMTSDSDDLLEDVRSLRIDTTVTLHNEHKSDKLIQRQPRVSVSKRKKGLKEKERTGKKFWTLKLKGKLRVNKRSQHRSDIELNSTTSKGDLCVCTSYRSTDTDASARASAAGDNEGSAEATTFPFSVLARLVSPSSSERLATTRDHQSTSSGRRADGETAAHDRPLDHLANINELYPITDIDEQRIAERRAEMERGIDIEQVWVPKTEQASVTGRTSTVINVCSSCGDNPVGQYPSTYGAMGLLPQVTVSPTCLSSSTGGCTIQSPLNLGLLWSPLLSPPPGVHTQVDYIHYLVAELDKIVGSCFYWGVMDRYEAEKLIENKPEGTFLLRDSAQDEFLFSVSFRRYGRSLHARIEQWNHKFSFDSRDPGVFAAESVCGLIDHYKDPSCCMFFEPLLTLPLPRTFPFSLQHLTRSVICSRLTYDGINDLTLPRTLKEYLRCYHYKQKIRVRRFDTAS